MPADMILRSLGVATTSNGYQLSLTWPSGRYTPGYSSNLSAMTFLPTALTHCRG
ncbi:hypothetical protein [Dickeya zeae]|uniref:hypothetical protein n=1 Tax=Dickeya zeae TaxID=204042 RepID=UPI00144316E1|nr:hypothetical protein [Dickeya zeae]